MIYRAFIKGDAKMLNKRRSYSFLAIVTVALLSGCQSAAFHRADVQDNSTDRMTVGKVQKEIRVGMSGADVAQALGSPNIVSTDEERREVWIYDKIATDRAYSSSSGGVNALILGFGGVPQVASGLAAVLRQALLQQASARLPSSSSLTKTEKSATLPITLRGSNK